MDALTADRVDVARPRMLVGGQVVEGRDGLALAPPKNRRRRVTMYSARTPAGAGERSNYRCNTFDPPPTLLAGPDGSTAGRCATRACPSPAPASRT